ncbi:MAG: TonB-dependent receptor [Pseudomonadota bacterium]
MSPKSKKSDAWQLLLFGVIFAQPVMVQADSEYQSYNFDVDAQRTDKSLLEIARTGEVQVLFAPQPVEKHNSPPVRGTYTVDSALELSLSDSDLEYEFKTDDFVLVSSKGSGSASTSNLPKVAPSSAQSGILLAQLQSDQSRDQAIEALEVEDESSFNEEESELDTIVVTGSRIEGYASSKPTVVIDADLIESFGYDTLEDVFRSLPVSFSGYSESDGIGEDGFFANPSIEVPQSGDVTILSLGALGPGSTLVLLDGRRLPSSAVGGGSYTDVSGIPLFMIERIEILPAGSAALYGADAVAGVINIILKKDAEGGELSAEFRHSDHDAHYRQYSGSYTKSWGSGKVTLNGDYSDYDGARLEKIWSGRPSELLGDWRDLGGSSFRDVRASQPGMIFLSDHSVAAGSTQLPDFLIPAGQDGTNLQIEDLIPFTGTLEDLPTGLLQRSHVTNPSKKWSVSLFFDQELGGDYDLSVGTLYSEQQFPRDNFAGTYTTRAPIPVPSSNPYSPFRDSSAMPQEIFVRYTPFAEEVAGILFGDGNQHADTIQWSAYAGIEGPLPFLREWTFDARYSYGEHETCCTAESFGLDARSQLSNNQQGLDFDGNPISDDLILNLFGDGSANTAAMFNALDSGTLFNDPSVSRVHHGTLEFSGSVASLPAGDIKVSILAETLREKIYNNGSPRPTGLRRDSDAISAQAFVPVLGSGNPESNSASLVFDGAIRWEKKKSAGVVTDNFFDFATFSRTTDVRDAEGKSDIFNAEVGLTWKPITTLKLRGSWSEAYLAPSFAQSFGSTSGTSFPGAVFAVFGLDPTATYINTNGPNSNLRPQTSTTLTAGLDYSPSLIDGLVFNVTWSNTTVDNYIASPRSFVPNVVTFFANAELFPEFVTITPGTPGPTVEVDNRFINFAGRELERLDLGLTYSTESSIGSWDFSVQAAHVIKAPFFLRDDESEDFVGTDKGPAKWRGFANVTWRHGPFAVTTTVNYDHGLRGTVVDPDFNFGAGGQLQGFAPLTEVDVSSVTTVNLDVKYSLGNDSPGVLKGTSVRVGVIDLFDADLQFLNNRIGYNNITGNSDGRTFRVNVTKRF